MFLECLAIYGAYKLISGVKVTVGSEAQEYHNSRAFEASLLRNQRKQYHGPFLGPHFVRKSYYDYPEDRFQSPLSR